MQMMKKRIKFMFKVKPLVYKSTENVKELKEVAAVMEEENQKLKNKEDINIKKMKQKMIRILVISIVFALTVIGIAYGCKYL